MCPKGPIQTLLSTPLSPRLLKKSSKHYYSPALSLSFLLSHPYLNLKPVVSKARKERRSNSLNRRIAAKHFCSRTQRLIRRPLRRGITLRVSGVIWRGRKGSLVFSGHQVPIRGYKLQQSQLILPDETRGHAALRQTCPCHQSGRGTAGE